MDRGHGSRRKSDLGGGWTVGGVRQTASNSGDTIRNSPPLAIGISSGAFGALMPGSPVRRPPLLDPEPDRAPAWPVGLHHELPNGLKQRPNALVVARDLAFEIRQLGGKLPLKRQHLTQPDERPHEFRGHHTELDGATGTADSDSASLAFQHRRIVSIRTVP
jgi:hypothetical protein